jgi:hypothetical protein
MANDMIGASFSRLDTRVKWVMAAFTVYLILSVASFISDIFQTQLVSREINGGLVTVAEAAANDSRQALIGWVQIVANFATAITFFVWIHRAYKNLYSFGPLGLRFSPGWSIGWFFVPIASLFRPYQVMSEIGSNSEGDPISANSGVFKGGSRSTMVGWWWTLFLLTNVMGQILFRVVLNAQTPSAILNSTYAYMAATVVNVIGVIVTIIMVRQISQLQETKNRMKQSGQIASFSQLGVTEPPNPSM